MRKVTTAALLALGLVSTGAFAQQSAAPLRTVVDPLSAPLSMTKPGGGLEGYSVDLLHLLAKQLDRKIEIGAMQFSGVFPAMQAGNIDFAPPVVTATALRAESMLFSEGIIDVDYQFVVPANGPALDKIEAFRGKTISVNKGTNYDAWARSKAAETGWIVESYGSTNDAIAAALSGRSVAALTNNTQVDWAVRQNPRLKAAFIHRTGDVMTIAFRKDSAELRNTVDSAIECLKARGELVKIYKKWFGDASTPGPAVVKATPGFGTPGFDGYDAQEHKPSCGQG